MQIAPDGTCYVIWHDALQLGQLGRAYVIRASDCEFDNQAQGWRVQFRNGSALPGLFESREQALAAEVAYIHAHLAEFATWAQQQRGEEESDGRNTAEHL
jgi:hypothetical protein